MSAIARFFTQFYTIFESDSAEFQQWKHQFAVKRMQILTTVGFFVLIGITMTEALISSQRYEEFIEGVVIIVIMTPILIISRLLSTKRPEFVFGTLLWVSCIILVVFRLELYMPIGDELLVLPVRELSFVLFCGVAFFPVYWHIHLISHIATVSSLLLIVSTLEVELPTNDPNAWLWLIATNLVALSAIILQENGYRRQNMLMLKLQSAENEYRTIFDNAAEGIYRSRPGGGFLTVNNALARILGYDSPEALLADDPDIGAMFLTPNGREELPKMEDEFGRVNNIELTLQRPDGKQIEVLLNGRRGSENGNVFYEGLMKDITVQKQAERALESRERILSAIGFAAEQFLRAPSWESVADGVLQRFGEATGAERSFMFEITRRDEIAYATLRSAWRAESVPNLSGQSRFSDIPLNTFGFEKWVTQLEAGQTIQLKANDFPKEAQSVLEWMHVHTFVTVPVFVAERFWGCLGFATQDLIRMWSSAEIGALEIAANNLGAAIERERIMQELWLGQKQKSIGVLVGGIAHDFNNLLTGMLTQTSLATLLLPQENAARGHIEKAVVSAERAADLTRQLLAYAGKGRFQLEPVDMNRLLNDNLGLFELALPTQVALNLDLDSRLPFVEADRGQMQQLIMNLVLNAGEAMERKSQGVLTIRTTVTYIESGGQNVQYLGNEQLDAGAYVYVEVADTGVGMDEMTLASIFDPYYTTKPQGQGLGLSATLGIIRSHHGGLRVESTCDIGSIFKIWLPVATEHEIVEPPNIAPEKEQNSMIMVVDDEALVREAVHDILEMQGIEVVLAASGQEGVDLYRERKSDIRAIVLDMRMPGMNGRDTYYALKAVDPEVTVVMSSGYSEMEVSKQFEPGEISGFLQKPYNFDRLITTVQSLLPDAV